MSPAWGFCDRSGGRGRHAEGIRVSVPARARCLYLDLDGTLLGKRRVAAARRRGQRVDRRRARGAGVHARRRGGGADVRAPPRAGVRGRAAARSELFHLRGGRVRGAGRGGALADGGPVAGRAEHRRADRALGRAGIAARALRRVAWSTTSRGTSSARSRTCSAASSTPSRSTLCWPSTATATCG